MKKTTILRVIALLAALLMLCACQKAVPAGGEAESNDSQSTTADTREPVSVNILAVGDNLIHGVIYNQAPARRPAAMILHMPIKISPLPSQAPI